MLYHLTLTLLFSFGLLPDPQSHPGNGSTEASAASSEVRNKFKHVPKNILQESSSVFQAVHQASRAFPGWTWAIELQNHANMSLHMLCINSSAGLTRNKSEVTSHSNSDAAKRVDRSKLDPGQHYLALYSVETALVPKLQIAFRFLTPELHPTMNLVYGISWPFNYAFDMTLTRSERSPSEFCQRNDLTIHHAGNYGVLSKQKSGYVVDAHAKATYEKAVGKLLVVIRVRNAPE